MIARDVLMLCPQTILSIRIRFRRIQPVHEMKNFVLIIAAHGGLERLAVRPLRIERPGYDSLIITHFGTGLTGPPMQQISVAWLRPDLPEDSFLTELFFDVSPSNDRKTGWASGTWSPLSFWVTGGDGYQFQAVRVRRGKVFSTPWAVSELRGLAQSWNRGIRDDGFLYEVLLDAGQSERRDGSLARVDAERQHITRARDERGRWLKLA